MGPGFRWTVAVPKDTQAAMTWIREHTRVEAVSRCRSVRAGRETWTLVPTFAARRMAAGQPISLLHVTEYDERSRRMDAMFRTTNAAEAARLAHASGSTTSTSTASNGRPSAPRRSTSSDDLDRYFTPVFQQG